MIGRLAVRSLTAHPVRSAVLAAGFGLGVAVMAILLGVAQIVLEQSRAPGLVGGGDVVVSTTSNVPARLLLAGTLQADTLRPRIRAAAPSHSSTLFLLRNGKSMPVTGTGGIPSLQRAVGDRESTAIAAWRDSADDAAWTRDAPEAVLRHIDRFHPVPVAAAWQRSWAEWLYFNGRAGDALLHVTFLVGPPAEDRVRPAQVRVQLDRGSGMETYIDTGRISEADALLAPDLTIGTSAVRLEGTRYRIHLDLRTGDGRRVRGDLTLRAASANPLLNVLMPPFEIQGARGWRTGYVVPVMAGALEGTIQVGGDHVSFAGGVGYHDHNWGFWQDVSWRWGHVQHDGLAVLYGRLLPPPDAADPERLGAFLGVLGPEGPLAYATDLTITETDDPTTGRPRVVSVSARGANVDIRLHFDVKSAAITRAGELGPVASGLDFLQMRGTYTVTGRAGARQLQFTAPGSAETFRGRAPAAPPSARAGGGG